MNKHKLLRKVLSSPNNVRFQEMVSLILAFGYRLDRTAGSHHIFVHPDIPELMNLQDVHGQAKPYQIRQFIKLIERYSLSLKEREP